MNRLTIVRKTERSDRELTITLPASKSISNRALILSALADSPFPIHNLAQCDDTDVMVKVLDSNNADFNIGAAGTAMRFLTAYLAKIGGKWSITGSERMKNRPIKILVDALNGLGANITYGEREGYPPLIIKGRALMGGTIELNPTVSSQYVSALMMIAPTMHNGLTIRFTDVPISMPYILMTQHLLKRYGISSEVHTTNIRIPKGQHFTAEPITVEADWSAASYWYAIVALSNEKLTIHLPGLHKKSVQGDANGAQLFEKLGVHTTYTSQGITLTRCDVGTKKLVYDFTNEPDIAQTLVVTCCALRMPFYFSGLQSLKIKETDRLNALITECKKLGYTLTESKPNVLTYEGEQHQYTPPTCIATYDDHRMAMAFAPIALTGQAIEIEHPEVVSKSYPNFWNDLSKVTDIHPSK